MTEPRDDEGRPLMLRWFDESGAPWFYVRVTHAEGSGAVPLQGAVNVVIQNGTEASDVH